MASKKNIFFKDQSGIALVVALIIMIVLTLIGLASIFTSTFEIKLSGNKRGSTDAFYTADGGAQAVLVYSSNFIISTNPINFRPVGTLPSHLQNESIDTALSWNSVPSPLIGINFVDTPRVTIYHSTDSRCEEGTSATSENFDCERFLIDSIGRDQTDVGLLKSTSEVLEKVLKHVPK